MNGKKPHRREYFMENMDTTTMNTDDTVIVTLRRCGHYLHHSAGKESGKTNAELLAALNDDEKKTLAELLGKCLKSWKE